MSSVLLMSRIVVFTVFDFVIIAHTAVIIYFHPVWQRPSVAHFFVFSLMERKLSLSSRVNNANQQHNSTYLFGIGVEMTRYAFSLYQHFWYVMNEQQKLINAKSKSKAILVINKIWANVLLLMSYWLCFCLLVYQKRSR